MYSMGADCTNMHLNILETLQKYLEKNKPKMATFLESVCFSCNQTMGFKIMYDKNRITK